MGTNTISALFLLLAVSFALGSQRTVPISNAPLTSRKSRNVAVQVSGLNAHFVNDDLDDPHVPIPSPTPDCDPLAAPEPRSGNPSNNLSPCAPPIILPSGLSEGD